MTSRSIQVTSVGENVFSPELTKESLVNDASNAVQVSRRFLTFLGVWRSEDVEKFSMRLVFANISVMFYYFAIGIRTIPMIVYLAIDAKGTYATLNIIARLVFSIIAGTKYVFLHYHEHDIAKCMKHMELDWLRVRSRASRKVMRHYALYGLLMSRIYVAFTFSAGLWFAILPFVLSKGPSGAINDNDTIVVVVRRFPVPSNFGFSLATKTPLFEMIYAMQSIATFMLHSIQVSACSLTTTIVMHACGQLNILMNMINQLIDAADENESCDSFNDKLSTIVRFIATGEKMLRGICLVDLGGCTTALCFTAYFILLEFRAENRNFVGIMVYLTLMGTWTFNIFSFCYIGELLTQQCEKIGQITYMTDWHCLSRKQPRTLCLIIAMSQSPMTITAGGMIPLSYKCFTNVIKTSMGYLNMLRAVTE